MGTHHVFNSTASTVTVSANSVAARSTKILVLSDADAHTFATTAGVTLAQLAPGQAASDGEFQAELVGYWRGY